MIEKLNRRQRKLLARSQQPVETWDMPAIKRLSFSKGRKFFDPVDLGARKKKVYPLVYQGGGGVYFVSSEHVDDGSIDGRRVYVVHQFDPASAVVTTIGGQYKVKIDAVEKAKSLAGGAS